MTRYQLSVTADNLPKRMFGAPNPYAFVTVVGGPSEGMDVGRTETIPGTRQADFCKVLFLETESAVFMPLKIQIYHDPEKLGTCKNNDLLGEVTFEATDIFQSSGRSKSEKIRNGAIISAVLEESMKGTDFGTADISIRGLDIKNVEPGFFGLGRTDPFFELAKKDADHAVGIVRWNVVYRSEHIENHLNPFWRPLSISLEELCYCNLDWPLRIQLYDHQKNGSTNRMIGFLETSLRRLAAQLSIRGNADRERAFEIFSEERNTTVGLICALHVYIVSLEGTEIGLE